MCYGPSPNPGFPFVLLGRAPEHHRLLACRTHAHREPLELAKPLLDFASDSDRRHLGKLFAMVRMEKELPAQQTALADIVYKYALRADDPDTGANGSIGLIRPPLSARARVT